MTTSLHTWPPGVLFSPLSGRQLEPRGAVLVAGDEIWPVIDGIPYLRANRVELARTAAFLVESGNSDDAAALLLTDQDDYAPDPSPRVADCLQLVRNEASFSFRTAMRQLSFGRVADYFAYRWTDPTYLSGLALSQLANSGSRLELASGVGHFLRAFAASGVEAAGADIVFAKLWLTRHFICPQARLVCFDAASPWPLQNGAFDCVFCHDAFYFMPDKTAIIARMHSVLRGAGQIIVGHAHNAAVDNHSAGSALRVEAYAALLPGSLLFDDRELAAAYVEARSPVPAEAQTLAAVPAVSLVWPSVFADVQTKCTLGRRLPLNPLYQRDGGEARIVWPSQRYEQEYAALVTYPARWSGPDELVIDGSDLSATLVRRGIYVDLPSRW